VKTRQSLASYQVSTKYADDADVVFMSGTQALVRVIFDQMRADRRQGLRTAAFVSGYPGSPLGGFDQELQRQRAACEELGITHLPGQNEDLAATAVWGSQLAGTFPGARYDGVLGVWYAKAPGVDRSGDALRHAQFVGTARTGGVLAYVGEDPAAKSSSLPSTTEHTLEDLGLPSLFPADVRDIIELGGYGVAMSRLSGLWTAVRVTTSVADGTADVRLGAEPDIVIPALTWRGNDFTPTVRGTLLIPHSLEAEPEVRGPRLELAARFGYENGINHIRTGPAQPWLSIIVTGHLLGETLTALTALGIRESDLYDLGVRLCHVRMPFPIDPRTIEEFARGARFVFVVEEKRAYIERRVRDVLYGQANQPVVLGKRDRDGGALVPDSGALDADGIAGPLRRVLGIQIAASRLAAEASGPRSLPVISTARTPYFCSGCPHNSSLRVPEGTVVGGGIGCHAMARFIGPHIPAAFEMSTHMGAEGAQFLGIGPFVEAGHFVQNLGDGTYFHSGQLAVQAAVAAGAKITYKILYNDVIAMTGGQRTSESNSRPVADLCQILLSQGVARIVVTTEDPDRYKGVRLPSGVDVRDRSRILDVQRELAGVGGVTVLIHDQRCAAENRRDRRRGRLPSPASQLVINERVCEGCGDCGVKSNCLSVEPVSTEYGRKTRINADSCNFDFSCLAGDCPSFLTVEPGGTGLWARLTRRRRPAGSVPPDSPADASVRPSGPGALDELLRTPLPEPARRRSDAMIRMPGIGGTGVVTASQILGTAAMLDGLSVSGLDQTGLSQKAGPVVSDLRISGAPVTQSNKASQHSVDLLLGFDILTGAAAITQAALMPGRTIAVISTTQSPTGAMASSPAVTYPDIGDFQAAVTSRLGADNVRFVDVARLCREHLGSAAGANIALIGLAYQLGGIPASAASIERAITLNGVAVESNIRAFRLGRLHVAEPGRTALPAGPAERAARQGDRVAELAAELERYQDRAYARRFLDTVEFIADAAAAAGDADGQLARAAADGLFRLMAYKDEYEVARLLLDPAEEARLRAQVGPGARVSWNLHPPALKALGLGRKIRLGPWFRPVLRMLAASRRLRGTRLDPFGRSEVRRIERRLRDDYTAALLQVGRELRPGSLTAAVGIARLPEQVTGYENLKLDRGRRMLAELERELARMTGPAPAS
jgi:indolepyruvate ferredoxin oxidoreductase